MGFRPEQSDNERLARKVTGPDTDAIYMEMSGDSVVDDTLRRARTERFNRDVGDLQERFQGYVDSFQEAGRRIAADMRNIEIMPLGSYALVSPFKENPFQQIRTDKATGLITDLGGLAPVYKSQETGAVEEERQYVKVGMVVETGADCRFLKPGDIVIYNINSEVQVPFFKFGFVVVAEQRVIAAVNEGLSSRKEEVRGACAE